jgi:hypothetical protein
MNLLPYCNLRDTNAHANKEGAPQSAQGLLPVVQLEVRVRDGDRCILQIPRGASDVSCGHVVSRVVVESNHQNAPVMTIRGEDDKIVQGFEVPVVPGQDCTPLANGMGQMDLIAAAGQADVGGDLKIVPVAAQQSDEARIDAVVVEVEPQRPSLTRSSVERGRGLPLD